MVESARNTKPLPLSPSMTLHSVPLAAARAEANSEIAFRSRVDVPSLQWKSAPAASKLPECIVTEFG